MVSSYVAGDMFSKNKKHPDQILPEHCRDALHNILVLLKKLSSSDKDVHISHCRSFVLFCFVFPKQTNIRPVTLVKIVLKKSIN